MSASLRRSERELLEWNRRQAEVVAGFAERYERTAAPSRRAGSAALNRSPYYVPAEEPAEGSERFDAYAGPKAAAIAVARQALNSVGGVVQPPTLARRGVRAGVQLGWLKRFAKRVQPGASTFDVVMKIIKPATKERLCRYVVLAEEESPGAVSTATIFASHTWRAPFRDLVAALAHVAHDKDYVWIDVRRRPARRRRAALRRAAN